MTALLLAAALARGTGGPPVSDRQATGGPPVPRAGAAHEVVLLDGNRPPVRVRLRILLDGQALGPYEAELFRWALGGYGERLDAATLRQALRAHPLYRSVPGSRPTPEALGLAGGGSVTEVVKRCLRRSEGRLLQVKVLPAAQPHPALLTRALAKALANRDGRVTPAGLKGADERLLKSFDVDEDECITPFELVPELLTARPPTAPRRGRTTALVIHPGMTAGDWLGRVMAHYGGDARPSKAQVLAWFAGKPDRDITVDLGKPRFSRVCWTQNGTAFDVGVRAALPAESQPEVRGLVTLWIEPGPRGWFEMLDTNRDGQLSVHEMRRAWESLADAEAQKKGSLAPPDAKTPAWTLTLVPGLDQDHATPLTRERVAARCGPAWFQAMDRNGDGFVSRREFLGTAAQFRKLDRDGDGLISPEEAEEQRR
jgi:hypothetical protein